MASATDTPACRPLEPAVLELRDGTPWSPRYGDVYFSRGHGPEESTAVFLRASGLPHRWQGREGFTIAETGFGTGLNFLLTLALWRAHPGPGWLHFLSAELHPFTPGDLRPGWWRPCPRVSRLPAGNCWPATRSRCRAFTGWSFPGSG
jgi:tRNA 5-methylaminomethyl-2-thiouridine biosynthesis bifunctional protein